MLKCFLQEFGKRDWSSKFFKNMLKLFSQAVGFVALWPVIAHCRKFFFEARFLTTSGTTRIKNRKKFEECTIVSSRATISEVFRCASIS